MGYFQTNCLVISEESPQMSDVKICLICLIPKTTFKRDYLVDKAYMGNSLSCLELLLVIMIVIIIHMKKLLDSDWPRAVQFKCNTVAKSVTPVQITHRNSG